jgi:nucleoside-diphosphate-sugar epimerase
MMTIYRLASRIKSNKLRIVGDGKNLVDFTDIENAVDAVLLAAASVEKCNGTFAGKSSFDDFLEKEGHTM